MAVSSLRKAAEILTEVNSQSDLAARCTVLADEVESALRKHAVYNHPEYGKIYAPLRMEQGQPILLQRTGR